MQSQLKSFGDTSTPPSSSTRSYHPRRSASKKTGSSNSFLATDVTTLDINTMFQSKKTKRQSSGGATPTTTPLSYLQTTPPFPFHSYLSPSLYPNMDLLGGVPSTELPPLMSVPAFKPTSLLQGFNDPMDFSKFSDELSALSALSANSPALHSLFGAQDQSYLASPPLPKQSSRGVHGRKNRMVEVKVVQGSPAVFVSDPQAASASSRPHIVHLNETVLDVLKGLESSKKRPISPEPLYSRKVFIGGLPIDVTEEEVWATFGWFGKVLVDWPRRPEHGGRGDVYEMDLGRRSSRSVSGYVFLVFQDEKAVQKLVNACEFYENKHYLQLSSPTMCDKAVQVRAWRLSDIDYFCDETSSVDHRRTVFIGGVPRPTRASDLAHCLQEHYGKVSYVGIDIDPELKYPKGAARVTFATEQAFVRAISGRFVQVTHADTNKRVEIKPYVMEDQVCDECVGALCKHLYAPYFCGDPSCLQYYCEQCWDRMHYQTDSTRGDHRPMVRTGDQTRVLPRPPHHHSTNSYHHHHRSAPVTSSVHHHHQAHHHPTPTASIQDHSPSIISRIVNRNSTSPSVIQKPFSAIPTAIGY